MEYIHRRGCRCGRVFRARDPGQYVHQSTQCQGQGEQKTRDLNCEIQPLGIKYDTFMGNNRNFFKCAS